MAQPKDIHYEHCWIWATYLCTYHAISNECALAGFIYLGTLQMNPGSGYTSIPLSHCEDTPTPSPRCQCNSGHWCGWAILPQCRILEQQWLLKWQHDAHSLPALNCAVTYWYSQLCSYSLQFASWFGHKATCQAATLSSLKPQFVTQSSSPHRARPLW